VSVWSRRILPRLIDLVMRNEAAAAERARLVPRASGVVLEIGIGSALNLPYYTSAVRSLYGVDPSRELWDIGSRRLRAHAFPVRYVVASAEALPFADGRIDTVVTTWTLCSIPDARAALAEMRRVLRPDGRLIFIEHGLSPDPSVRTWQGRLTPLWARIAGGCHLNRPIDVLLEGAGFRPSALDRGYGEGPRPMSYLYKGVAVAAERA
jgi:ubiquinone/menaquinone biosynthesis C-methylase UbiE